MDVGDGTAEKMRPPAGVASRRQGAGAWVRCDLANRYIGTYLNGASEYATLLPSVT
jgi:hypothetical protein